MRKKILQLQSSSGFYGAEHVIAQLAAALKDSEYEPHIGVINNLKEPHLELLDFAQRGQIPSQAFACRGPIDPITIFTLRRYLKEQSISLIQTHGYKANFYALMASTKSKIPLLATCHPWIKTSRKGRFYASFDKKVLRKFHRIVAISEEVKKELPLSPSLLQRVTVIDNGIDINPFIEKYNSQEIKKEYRIPGNATVIGSVGRLDIEKGHEILLDALAPLCKENPLLFVVIAGNGSLKQQLELKAKALGIAEQVRFPGFVQTVHRLLALFDIFILPSLTEGLPMALLEAMAAKRPIIASATGAIPKLIISHRTGLLVPPGDRNGLQHAIQNLLTNRENAGEMALNAFYKVRVEFNSTKMVDRYKEIYHDLLLQG